MRRRIDWNYLLGLRLEDPGFDFSVLSDFRTPLVVGNAEHLLLDALLNTCMAHGLPRTRGCQRTGSTHVLGALRTLNRLEQVAETVRASLEAVARADPVWLQAHTPADGVTRYGRIEDYRLPQGQEARDLRAPRGRRRSGSSDHAVRTRRSSRPVGPRRRRHPAADLDSAPSGLGGAGSPAHARGPARASHQIASPHEAEARCATKRAMSWVG